MAFKSPKEEEIMTYFVSLLILMLIWKISQIIYHYSYRNIAKHLLRQFEMIISLVNFGSNHSPSFLFLICQKQLNLLVNGILSEHHQGLSYSIFEIFAISITLRTSFHSKLCWWLHICHQLFPLFTDGFLHLSHIRLFTEWFLWDYPQYTYYNLLIECLTKYSEPHRFSLLRKAMTAINMSASGARKKM